MRFCWSHIVLLAFRLNKWAARVRLFSPSHCVISSANTVVEGRILAIDECSVWVLSRWQEWQHWGVLKHPSIVTQSIVRNCHQNTHSSLHYLSSVPIDLWSGTNVTIKLVHNIPNQEKPNVVLHKPLSVLDVEVKVDGFDRKYGIETFNICVFGLRNDDSVLN